MSDKTARRRGLARGLLVAAGVLTLLAQPLPATAQPDAGDITRVFGTEKPRMFEPRVDVANFGVTGPGGKPNVRLAGATRWDHDADDTVYNDTWGPWLWSSNEGPRPQFANIPDNLYFTPSFYTPTDIADDGTTVGTVLFRLQAVNVPWAWTPDGGFEFLPLPDDPAWLGSAEAVSRDGRVIAGYLDRRGPRGAIIESQAVTWVDGVRVDLPASGQFAQVSGINASGNVVVGAAGLQRTALQAIRWVDGVQQQLQPVGVNSVARHSSADGSISVGTATMANNAVVLVKWGANGAAEILGPPEGMSIASVEAINPDGTAIVGAVADTIPIPSPVIEGNYAPFLWRQDIGFTALPELEPADQYDRSVAHDVSDDGRTVVGALRQSVTNPTDPPNPAIIWIDGQLVTVNDLMREAGEADPDYFDAGAISGDGRWILAKGGPRRNEQDSLTSIFRLADARGDVEVTIDIKPGSADNPINLRSGGVTPVAIVSTPDFDATTVDPSSVRFGPAKAAETHGRGHPQDVNGDGVRDLVLHFTTRDSGITRGDTEGCLTGSTTTGQTIFGCDRVTVTG